mgnify:CR=1 FL=1
MRGFRHNPSAVAAALYLGLSAAAAAAFVALATWKGEVSWASRLIGAAWVFLLVAIVLMPVMIPRVQKRMQGRWRTMEKVYRVPKMSCSGCVSTVERTVRSVPGVRSVDVDLATKEVRVVFEEGAVNEELLKQALQQAGYPVAA